MNDGSPDQLGICVLVEGFTFIINVSCFVFFLRRVCIGASIQGFSAFELRASMHLLGFAFSKPAGISLQIS